MKVIKDLSEFKAYRASLGEASVGLVTTMGCLHIGHASLLKRSRAENDISLLTIFVNPAQFNDPADYARYPKTEQADLAIAEAMGVDCVLMPERSSMYPTEHMISCTTKQPLSQMMEGVHRPGHFDGVLTIVLKFFILTRATRTYFGEKDYQQLRLVQSLAENFLLDTEVIGCSTLREDTKLPLSSRNTLLSPEERKMADDFAAIFQKARFTTLAQTQAELEQQGIQVEYIEAYQDRILAAVKVGRIRLIDNIVVPVE
jgi:pantoate--beta-alanine ligase